MSVWLFDLGNTRLKFAPLDAGGRVGAVTAIAHGDGQHWLEALPRGEVALVASVASHARRVALLEVLAPCMRRVHRVHPQARLGRLRIAYTDPAQLGVDRFLALLDAADGDAALVVGIGTAMTIDLVDGQGRHRGGRIAPSPRLMRDALHARAASLPPGGGAYVEFADATADGLASGCEGAALALVERSLAEAQALIGMRPALRLHGGGAQALRSRLPAHHWVPDAVLRGLACWHRACLA